MSGKMNEEMSIKERTKNRFDLLLKAALDDVKGNNSKTEKLTEEDNEIHEDNIGREIYKDLELKKLWVKNKQKENKEGVLNVGFNENVGQFESRRSKNHYALPAVFSKSKKETPPDNIELVACGNSEPVDGESSKRNDLETNCCVKSEIADAIIGEGRATDKPEPRKPRKKKKRTVKTSSSANPVALKEINDLKDGDISNNLKREGKMKSKLAEQSDSVVVLPHPSSADEENVAEAKRANQEDKSEDDGSDGTPKDQILSVKIHRVDRLKMNVVIKHPLVRVHVVDSSTGACIKHKIRKQGSQGHEIIKANIEFLLPAMTLPFKLKEKRSVLPMWEEILLFNESFKYLTSKSTNAILFFEVLDFLPMTAASSQYSKLGAESGWYHIAWAFLKIVGANMKLNVGRRLQLQLYFPPKHRIRPEPRVLEVFHWWASCPRVPYPATLYVTVSSADAPEILQTTPLRPLNCQAGISGLDPKGSKIQSENIFTRKDKSDGDHLQQQWSRLPGQSCKIPNKLCLSLKTAAKGCLVAEFSHDGKLLACGCQDNDASPILIYEIPSGELLKKLLGHTSLIYELTFSATDDRLLSASADGTARVWSMQSSNQEPGKVLPHPSYVYTAQFHPITRSIVVTGCYDTVIRIWDIASEMEHQNHLIKELEGHNAYVNSICFKEDGTKMYSSDSKGTVHIWSVPDTKAKLKDASGGWNLHHKICCPELAGISVSKVLRHPKLDRLLVQSQDGVIRIFDEESSQILQCYKGHLNVCDYLRCCITTCGNFIFSGSEDHCVYAWNTVTGLQAAIYSNLPHRQTIHCTAFHPLDHMVAFCSFGSNVPLLIYKYDPLVGQLGVNRVQPQEELQTETSSAVVKSSSKSHSLSLDESKVVSGIDFPATSPEAHLKSIIKKLDSVLDFSSTANKSFQELEALEPNTTNLSWGSTFNGLGINPSAPTLKKVIAQFDYNPQRSDELPFRKGDIMSILDMESDQWWIGQLAEGRQGYVPAKFFDTLECDGDGSISCNRTKDILNSEEKYRSVTALLSKDGELTFMSASDDETPVTTSTPIKRQRQRRKKDKDADGASHC